MGFVISGNPMDIKQQQLDSQTSNRLSSRNNAIDLFYSQQCKLPASLKEIDTPSYELLATQPQNEITYIVKGPRTYSMCAKFNKESNENPNYVPYSDTNFHKHPAGYYCFDLTVKSTSAKCN